MDTKGFDKKNLAREIKRLERLMTTAARKQNVSNHRLYKSERDRLIYKLQSITDRERHLQIGIEEQQCHITDISTQAGWK